MGLLDEILSLKKSGVETPEDMRRNLEEAKREVTAETPEERAWAEFIRTPPISLPGLILGFVGVTAVAAIPIVVGHFILGRRPDAQISTVSVVLMALLGLWTYGYFKRAAPAAWDNRFALPLFAGIFILYGQLLAGLITWIFF